jgi:hypothetical protein
VGAVGSVGEMGEREREGGKAVVVGKGGLPLFLLTGLSCVGVGTVGSTEQGQPAVC